MTSSERIDRRPRERRQPACSERKGILPASRFLQAGRLRSLGLLLLILSLAAPFDLLSPAFGQRRRARRARVTKPRVDPNALDKKKLEQAIGLVCAERERDPLGSAPIDEMQSRPSLELNHPEAVIGAQRAQRLLPVAKELVIQALRQLATEYKIPAAGIRAASRRVLAVRDILPDPELRDNAAVVMSDPHTIRFGTIFLVGLPSDEGMISVLSHELTHIADGRPNSLAPLFQAVGRRATSSISLRINGQKAEELTCDLVGVRAARRFVAITPDKDSIRRRLARTLEHNCVDDDDTDEEHLSPRSTMRAVLALDPTLARQILEYEDDVLKELRFGQSTSRLVLPLTVSPTYFNHQPLR